ncbi:MAG TPA: SDR family NAD(P)-dependent oxidoreductase [Stellaceae bacterium]|jgi:acyl transferase domain-containing protein/NADPH:quinone reductase-like Zn-dependent oxidoreductase/acyl carrier protein|nr:SDR family NAD(P)-dependent oxidoreductase [Stellaceae bacterium]
MSDGLIAIIGASCRFPGADGIEAYWRLLADGVDAVRTIDDKRWSTRFFYHPGRGERGKSYTWAAGLIDGIDRFEPAFFGISPREAAQMDPQQRLMLELVWHAVEDAGIPASRLAGTDTGVFVGASSTDYRDIRVGDPSSSDSYSMTGGTLSILSNRVSYIFDLRGPSFTVDTACSSSLVALHQACEAIRAERVSAAIVGGVNILLSPFSYVGFCRAAMLSQTGHCYAFDERADGYVRSEGGGVVVLKPLARALADGDRIRAVIRGTGVNSDGRTIGLSLPNEAAQSDLLRSVYAGAGVAPDDLAFFEMHGTGTPAGDPIEASAVGVALGRGRRAKLPIGSVKSNLGHLEPASGMAGLIKATLALEHGLIPPSINSETPNPKIPFDELNLRVLQRPEPLPETGANCVGVNSFGFGGTNGHAVLSPAPRPAKQAPDDGGPLPPLVVSARSEAALRELVAEWSAADLTPVRLRAAARNRDHHPHRLVAFGADAAEITATLDDFLADPAASAAIAGAAVRDGKLAFVFSGNGAQFSDMGREAYRASAEFRAAIDEVDALLRPALGWSAADFLRDGIDAERLVRADYAQPLLFAIQIGITTVLRRIGIVATGHIGHSVGEVAAAWSAGALPLADAVRVIVARSRNQERTRGIGRMAALAASADTARELIAEMGSPIEVGAVNATQSVTLSGPGDAIEQLRKEARRRGIACRALDLEFAFHSDAMDRIRDELRNDLRGLASATPESLLVSTVTGEPVEAGQLDAEYWWRNVRRPVQFVDAMAALVASGHRIFVEIGASPVLQSYLHDALRAGETQGRVLGTLGKKDGAADPFPAIAARCHVAGHDLSGSPWFDGAADARGLPLYPWQRERFWYETTVEGPDLVNPQFLHPLLGFRAPGPLPAWVNHLDPELLPWLADHAIEGVPVLPAAAVLEMALAAARNRRPEARALEVADVELRRPLPFDKGQTRELRTRAEPEDGEWELSSRPRLSEETPTVHAVARIVTATDAPRVPTPPSATPVREVDAPALYRLAAGLGLDYGPNFRTVTRIAIMGPDEAIVDLDPSAIEPPLDLYLVHPALLDGALQGLLALIAGAEPQLRGVSFLPWRFGRVRLSAPFARPPRRAHLRVTRLGTRSASADIVLYDAAGAAVAELSECWFRRVELSRAAAIDERVLRVDLVPAPLDPPPRTIFADIDATLTALAAAHAGDPERGAEQALLLDALIAAIGFAAIRDLAGADTGFTVDRIAPHSAAVLDAQLHLLARFGAASLTGGEWRLLSPNDLPEPDEIWRLLLAEAPDLGAELGLVAAMAEDLPRLLSEGPDEGEPALPDPLDASPVTAAGIGFVCDTLGGLAASWPDGRPLRVLEIAAGGTATRRVLDRLAQSGVALAYTATNADADEAARLAFTVEPVTGATAQCWSPADGGDAFMPGSFDVALSVNGGARQPLDAAALSRLGELLGPGGLFLAVEPRPNPLWDLAFARDAGRRRREAALRSDEEWRAALEIAGFDAPAVRALATGPWPIMAIWARPAAGSPVAAKPVELPSVALVGDAGTLGRELQKLGHAVGEEGDIVVFPVEEAGDTVDHVAHAMTALARIAAAAAPRRQSLWIVTLGAQQAGEGLAGAALSGFGRVLVNEMPGLDLHLLDLPAKSSPAERARRLSAELAAGTTESEIVWTATGRHVLRLRRGLPPRWAGAADPIGLASAQPGRLDALGWSAIAPAAPGDGEIEIDVEAAALNFRDVMWGMGLLPEEALIDGFAGPTFGLECAGTVRAVGAGVDGLAIGDRVVGFAPAALATRVTTLARAVVPIPAGLDFAAAATAPVAFVTVFYALGTLGRLEAGETVLVHAAAGGVGLAAIQYAKHKGAIVIATAGSPAKRAFLRRAGADHVLDSRDLGFADAVRAITGGAGVDLVLNSLSGEAMENSIAVLKPFGRFLELGKRDFYQNRRIHLRPLRQNISYFAIDVDQLPIQRPDLAQSLLAEMAEALVSGAIRPLAHRVFPFAEVDDAFRLMQASGHIGKLVLVPSGNAAVRLREPPPPTLDSDGAYLVTGGLAGFGFEAARWLVQSGARSLALLGRRGADTPGAAERVAELAALGADIRIYAGDVAERASLGPVLAQIRARQGRLRGVVHAASAIGDGFAIDVKAEAASAILRPKIAGAIALDELTRDDPIDLFVLFSSATTLLGAPGQGIYVAANMALEALARHRRAAGRPALAVGWGPIEDAGYLADRPETRDALARRLGAKPIPAAQALAGLPALAASALPFAAFAETSWNEARRYLPILATSLFTEIRAEASSLPSDDSLLEKLAALDGDEAVSLLRSVVTEEAAGILRLPGSGIDAQRPLSELGMDSLMAVELRLALENRLRIDLPLVSLAEGTSVASIAARLAGAVSSRPQRDEVLTLAARYEVGEGAELAALAGDFEPADERSAAAE